MGKPWRFPGACDDLAGSDHATPPHELFVQTHSHYYCKNDPQTPMRSGISSKSSILDPPCRRAFVTHVRSYVRTEPTGPFQTTAATPAPNPRARRPWEGQSSRRRPSLLSDSMSRPASQSSTAPETGEVHSFKIVGCPLPAHHVDFVRVQSRKARDESHWTFGPAAKHAHNTSPQCTGAAFGLRCDPMPWSLCRDFGWFYARSDGHVAFRRCDPYTLEFTDHVLNRPMRWFIR